MDDIEWFLRAREREIPILVHPEVVPYYRRHEITCPIITIWARERTCAHSGVPSPRRAAAGQEGKTLAPFRQANTFAAKDTVEDRKEEAR